jgi:hypothetical protein
MAVWMVVWPGSPGRDALSTTSRPGESYFTTALLTRATSVPQELDIHVFASSQPAIPVSKTRIVTGTLSLRNWSFKEKTSSISIMAILFLCRWDICPAGFWTKTSEIITTIGSPSRLKMPAWPHNRVGQSHKSCIFKCHTNIGLWSSKTAPSKTLGLSKATHFMSHATTWFSDPTTVAKIR